MGKTGGTGTAPVAQPSWQRRTLLTIATVAVSGAGGFVANAFGLPAGWLMGGALAVAIAAIAGMQVHLPDRVRDLSFLLVGMSMGASVARDSLAMIPSWPVSLIGLVAELALIIATTGWMLTRLFKLDAGTAYLSSFPGHLSFIMSIATAGVGNARQIVIIQVIRVMLLTICVPVGALFLPIDHFAPVAPASTLGVWELLALAAGCAALGLVFVKLKVPAGFVLGAMAAATVAKLCGLYTASMPPVLTVITFVLTGAVIGSRFSGISRGELVSAAVGGLIATAMTVAIVTAIAFGVSLLVDMPFGQIWLGLSPGALEGMGALGVALGYDTAFIAAHHVIRLLLLTFAIPLVVMMIRRRERLSLPQSDTIVP